MDSDSDSDGSHVSATPPRESCPPSLPSPPLQPPIIFSNNSRTRVKTSSSSSTSKSSKYELRTSRPTKPPSKPDPESKSSHRDPSCNPFPLPNLPFQILRPSSSSTVLPTAQSIETLPAGYFSKSASFSKIRRPFVNFDTSGNATAIGSVPNGDSKSASNEIHCREGDFVAAEVKSEGVTARKSSKSGIGKRHPNLIGANVPMPAVKIRKCGGGGEGNFVRLNLNSKGRKFLNKGRYKNGISSGRRSYRRIKGKLKHKGDGQNETLPVFVEDGLATEITQQKPMGSCGRKDFDFEFIEEAVLAAQEKPSDENLLKLLKLIYGYDSFRDGQLEAIKMVLARKSTMLILPTGAGKSLCYQLPAILLPGTTLVVSPLVALMIDQLRQLPPIIKGSLLCSSQTPEEASETLKQLQKGAIKVLFVSPERLLNEEFLSIISATSAISLVVIDEAHCISEWSHNFRPSFMRLRASLLHNRLNVGSILAMTATATATTLDAIMCALDIPCTNLIQKAHLRDNFHLSISLTRNRMKDLLMLIKSSPFLEVQSIIIYCKFQKYGVYIGLTQGYGDIICCSFYTVSLEINNLDDSSGTKNSETDIISRHLNDNSISAKSYHSGITAKERRYVQELFASNKIRVVVATVAFGMGLDKRDIGAVIHYSLPESLEEYVQEIGRAGRDGRLSFCHLFYDDETYVKLRSLMHSDGVDEYAVNKFLCEVFPADNNSNGKICSLVKESASRRFDLKEEVMLTLLTRLELGDVQYLHLLPQLNVTCSLNFHKTPPLMLAHKDPAVAALLKRSENKQGLYIFDMPTVANDLRITAVELSNRLLDLKLMGEITYEMKDLAYCYRIVKVPTDFFSLSADLTKWLSEVESFKVRKLDAMFNAADFAVNSCDKMHGCNGTNHIPCLQKKILDYFAGVDKSDFPKKTCQSSPFLRADIKVFLQSNSQAKFTPRAIARIMHGIASPAYPSATWSKTHFWGRYTHIDFQVVIDAAKAELKNIVGKDML